MIKIPDCKHIQYNDILLEFKDQEDGGVELKVTHPRLGRPYSVLYYIPPKKRVVRGSE